MVDLVTAGKLNFSNFSSDSNSEAPHRRMLNGLISQQTLCQSQVLFKSVRVKIFLCWFDIEWFHKNFIVFSALKSTPPSKCYYEQDSLPISSMHCRGYNWIQSNLFCEWGCRQCKCCSIFVQWNPGQRCCYITANHEWHGSGWVT